jgi:hypothetical protein
LDGNGFRILARVMGIRRTFSSRGALEKELRPMEPHLRVAGRCDAIGEALMDLGATVCIPRNSHCGDCPLRRHCAVAKENIPPEAIPHILRGAVERETVHRIWWYDGETVWLRRSRGRRLLDLYEIPPLDDPELAVKLPIIFTGRRTIGGVHYGEIIHGEGRSLEHHPSPDDVPFPKEALGSVPLSGPHRRWCNLLIGRESAAGHSGGASRR